MPRTVTAPPPRGSMVFSNQTWGMLMKLAYDSGWKPMGCDVPEGWKALDADGNLNTFHSMDYFSRRGQRVIDEDAARIAAALTLALDDVPRFDALGLKVATRIDLPSMDRPLRALRAGVKVNPYEYFSGKGREPLEQFIGFCRGGGFAIT